MKTPEQIIEILRSIKDVRINEEMDEFQVKFEEESTTFPDGWEPNEGYIYNSFTQELLLLIEAELRGELADTSNSPHR